MTPGSLAPPGPPPEPYAAERSLLLRSGWTGTPTPGFEEALALRPPARVLAPEVLAYRARAGTEVELAAGPRPGGRIGSVFSVSVVSRRGPRKEWALDPRSEAFGEFYLAVRYARACLGLGIPPEERG